MNKWLMGFVFAVALLTAACRPAPTAAPTTGGETTTYDATLSGTAEYPDDSPGDPAGSGSASVTIDTAADEVCFTINVSGIGLPATMAHIHQAPVGQAGPPVITLTAPDANGQADGCVTADSDLLDDIVADPAGFYVMVHTSDFPAGAVRGHLSE